MTQLIVSVDNPIVSVKKHIDSFTVHWMIGKRCNFNCSYCPDKWHDNSSAHLTFEQLAAAWKKITDLNHSSTVYDISFMGGEPTLNKNFLPFLTWLHENFKNKLSNVGVITNGTASIKYYQDLVKYCNWITFSTHSEFMNEQKFFRNVLAAKKHSVNYHCMINVNIMNEYWHQDRNEQYKKFLTQHEISNYVHPVHEFGKQPIHYPIRATNKMSFV